MTIFLWTVVILMATALLAEVFAFIGMALVARRTARRAQEITELVKQRVEPSVRVIHELTESLQPQLEAIRRDSREAGVLVKTRLAVVQTVAADVGRRAARARLRLSEGVQTVEEQRRRSRGALREVVEPIRAAGTIFRGISLAIWLLRKVA